MGYSMRPATIDDVPPVTAIQNITSSTHITFDVQPHRPEDRVQWFRELPAFRLRVFNPETLSNEKRTDRPRPRSRETATGSAIT